LSSAKFLTPKTGTYYATNKKIGSEELEVRDFNILDKTRAPAEADIYRFCKDLSEGWARDGQKYTKTSSKFAVCRSSLFKFIEIGTIPTSLVVL